MTEKSLQIFSNESHFELAARQAKALSQSTLIPDCFQGKPSNCLIALEISNRLNISPFIVFQNLNVIYGKPGFSASFVIAQINSSGRFSQPLQFKVEGKGDSMQCIAWTSDHNGVVQEGPPVSISMAKAEGWFERKGSKWKTMADVMIRYRAATFFGRLYTPELLLGMQTTEELRDAGVIDVTPEPVAAPVAEDAHKEFDQAMNGQDLGKQMADEINKDFEEKRAPTKKRGRKPKQETKEATQEEIDEFKKDMKDPDPF